MNSIIGRSGFGAVVLCAVLLVGCDSIKDVRTEPFTPVPTQEYVLSGKVVGLGTARPVALSYDGSKNCLSPSPDNPSLFVPSDCKFYGVHGQNESGFSFGSFPEGKPYNIVVSSQPYGKVCTVANGSGTVGPGSTTPVVTCEPDPAIPRYDLTVNLATAVQTLPNLKVSVTTEEGVQEQDATGQTQVTFPGVLLNSGTNLPAFAYKVAATTDTTADGLTTSNLCTFTPVNVVGPNTITAGGENLLVPATLQEFTVVPSGPATVTVNACQFTVSATVEYNAAPGGTAQAMPGGGMTLALRDHATGVDVQTLEVSAFSATPVSFATPVMANAKAIYELVVTRPPTGQYCVVAGTTVTNADTTSAVAVAGSLNINAPTASAVLLVDPSNTDWWTGTPRAVLCRTIPAAENQLTGTYQMDRRQPDATFPNPGRGREFLTFFEDGTFLYGINFNAASLTGGFPNSTFPAATPLRSNAFASSGVNHGFYAYDRAAGTISFTVFTATNINSRGRGLTGMRAAEFIPTPRAAGPNTGPVTVSATGVEQGDGRLSMTFSWQTGVAPNLTTQTRLWTMSEPEHIPGELTGTWITADHRRMFAYHGGETFAFHIGVNGLGNLQDVCMLPTDDSTQSGGIMTKHAGSASNESFQYTCVPGAANLPVSIFAPYNTRTPDLPHYLPKNSTPSSLAGPTTPRTVPGFNGRFPGTASQLDNRPTSPVKFQVTPGAPDTLTVQNTLNGVPIGQPVTFYRTRTN